ncbi:MAG: DUF3619 family protein [Burkholderiaceae bacterium]|nr:MAG: DUF3619 family protein [Burkholderiaceae bacterium]
MNTAEDLGQNSPLVLNLRRQLDLGSQSLTLRQQHRLAQARKVALLQQRQVSHLQLALSGSHTLPHEHLKARHWAAALTCVLVLAGALLFLQEWEQSRHQEELADIDSAVLSDDLPVSAYLDHGFKHFVLAAQDGQ